MKGIHGLGLPRSLPAWWRLPYAERMKSLLGAAMAALFSVAALAADKNYTIAVIPKGTTHEFWKSIHAGAVKAEQELAAQGVTVKLFWKGPLREDDRDQQIQVVEVMDMVVIMVVIVWVV